MKDLNDLKNIAKKIRIDVIRMTHSAGEGHIGGSLSLCEILAVLYHHVMKYDPKNPLWQERDRLILSKGHGAIALYAALKTIGLLSDDEIMSYKKNDSFVTLHPSFMPQKGMEFASGSLGQGLSIGAGVAMALKLKNLSSKVFVIVGDGECNEGSIWEAAVTASHYKLSNLICVVDKNALQNDGATIDIQDMGDLAKKWDSFGWKTVNVDDGHDVNKLVNAFETEHDEKPLAVICNTIKGKGVSFMENNYKWHYSVMTNEQFKIAMNEQGIQNEIYAS